MEAEADITVEDVGVLEDSGTPKRNRKMRPD
jgi:hypothetical protein